MQIQYPGTEAIHSALQSIIRDCFWDSAVSEDDIRTIVGSDQVRLKQKLFAKIMYHSTDRIKALSVFSRDELHSLFQSFTPIRHERTVRRHLFALRNILFGEENPVEGLEWKKR